MKFKVKVSYTVWDCVEVEANSEQQAAEKAEEMLSACSLNEFNNDGASVSVTEIK